MEEEKTGRNDPCPCGSGQKFKKCCFGKPAKPKFSAKVIKAGKSEDQAAGLMSRFMEANQDKPASFEKTKRDFRVTTGQEKP